ncbi:tetratricopeptide (TPR) repeat protein [Pedobacter cryoconitis]|uniref:tetratricopeptide repeat protein n=1 Tax=Pedobacter cryoconitis TaxID=188932 RepID=UPI00160D48A0|nr:tetratricopeptide repeat protein [Pedobacter cryoconitis]MBB6271583.1 tetratricopeptide (TPR) repeat protein [Pedobacter cryoconitis]
METLNDFISFLQNVSPDDNAGNKKKAEYNGVFSFLLAKQDKENTFTGPQIHRCIDIYLDAVIACRKNDFQETDRLLELADGLLDTLPESHILPKMYKLSAWGNYYYKLERWDEAIAFMKEGLLLSAEVERQGYPILIFRRIEQIQNISRIYQKKGDLKKAADLLRNIIIFIYSGKVEGLIIDDWDYELIKAVALVQENALDSVFNQLASLNTTLMNTKDYDNRYFVLNFFNTFLADMPAEFYNRTITHNWMYVKYSYFNVTEETYFENLKAFLGDPEISEAYDHFKVNLLEQVIFYLNKDDIEYAAFVIAQIQKYAETNLKDFLGKPYRISSGKDVLLKVAV